MLLLHLIPILCLKRAFRNLGRKIENGARSLVGKDQKFNPYKRGFTNSKELGAKILEDVYDYNKTKKKTDRMNRELQRLGMKGGLEIDGVEVDRNLFRKIGDVDEDSNHGLISSFSSAFNGSGHDDTLSVFDKDTGGEDPCTENLLRMKHLLESREEDTEDGSLGVDSLLRGSVNSIEIFPGDVVSRKEVITITRSA